MFWTLELASYLEEAPWPATKDELIDYSIRSGAPIEVIENLQELEDEGEVYESIEDIWPDYPSQEDFLFNEDEYLKKPLGAFLVEGSTFNLTSSGTPRGHTAANQQILLHWVCK